MSLSSSFKLSPKQIEFITDSTAKINIAHGAIRSGKTHASLIRFAELVVDCPDNKILMVGNSFGAIKENAVKFLKDELFRGYCVWQQGKQTLLLGDKEIRVIGAHDEGSVRAIQGNTISLAYVDELTTIPTSFVDMLTTRLSHDHSMMVATCNPSSPVHPVKTHLIDSEDKDYCYSLHFEIDDNPGLSEKEKANLKTKYTGLFYKRFIQGLWIQAEGAIYSDFDRKYHVLPRSPGFAEQYYVGIDYGAQNPFAIVMIGYRSQHTPRFWVEKEYYWDPKKTFRQKTNSEYADDVERFIEGYNVRGIFLDPSAESFEVELKRRKIRVLEAENDVFAGITFVANLFSNHQLKVLDCCPNLISEIERYSWDPKKAQKGVEEPIKENDHACVTFDTRILTVDGYKSIFSLSSANEDVVLINYDRENQAVEYDIGKNVSKTREQADIYELELEDGKTLRATGDHKVLTDRGEVELQYLTLSDIVYTCNINTTLKSGSI